MSGTQAFKKNYIANENVAKAISTNTDYLLQPGLSQLHTENTEWESEIEMLKIDADFFDKMLAKAALFVVADNTYSAIHHKKTQLEQYQLGAAILSDKIQLHEQRLSAIIDKTAPHDEQPYRRVHDVLNNELSVFLKNYKQLKATIYSLLHPLLLEEHTWSNPL